METKEVGIHFGAIADPIAMQLKQQGWKFDKEKVKSFQQDFDALFRLRMHGLVSDSHMSSIVGKLHAQIVKHIATKNNGTVNKKKNK